MAAISPTTQEHSKRRVNYYYDPSFGHISFGQGHEMQPSRVRMTHHLLLNYHLHDHLIVYRPVHASFEELTAYHEKDYIEFLKTATINNSTEDQTTKFNIGSDCPIFEGLFDFCNISSGGSLAGASKLNKKEADIVINWMGGLHHAKKDKASGFCYTNDIVLAILELLKQHKRVLYVDIDVHHGDGVEEAFRTSDRVMTVSFHRYGNKVFPGTGGLNDIGEGDGRCYALNIPLKAGITDSSYTSIFTEVMTRVMDRYRPDAIVLQCGADSLVGDRLGYFNVTLRGHGSCVEFLRSYNIPLMLLGGGGYTPKNVARCWTYETSLAIKMELDDALPMNDYYNDFGPDHLLHIQPNFDRDDNSRSYLNTVKGSVFRNLDQLNFAPSVQMQPIPEDAIKGLNDKSLQEDSVDPDSRLHHAIMDGVVEDQGEFYDGETEGDDIRNEHNSKRAAEKEEDDEKPANKKPAEQRLL